MRTDVRERLTLTHAAAPLCRLPDAVLLNVLDFAEAGWAEEERILRRTAAAVNLVSKRFVDVGRRAMFRRVVVHWTTRRRPHLRNDPVPPPHVSKRIARLVAALRGHTGALPMVDRLELAFWTDGDDYFVDMRHEYIRDAPWRQLGALFELLRGHVTTLDLSISALRLGVLMQHHGAQLKALGASRLSFTFHGGSGPASHVVNGVGAVLARLGATLTALSVYGDEMEAFQGTRPIDGSDMAVAFAAPIVLPQLRTLRYTAGVDNMLPALMAMAPAIVSLDVGHDYDLVGIARLADSTCLQIRHLRWSPYAPSWRQCLDLSRFRNLVSFESTNNVSVAFDAGSLDALERLHFGPEGLIDQHPPRGKGYDDTSVQELAVALEDDTLWPNLRIVSVTTPRPARDSDYDRPWMRAVGEAVEVVRTACETRRGSVRFVLV